MTDHDPQPHGEDDERTEEAAREWAVGATPDEHSRIAAEDADDPIDHEEDPELADEAAEEWDPPITGDDDPAPEGRAADA